VVGTVQEEQGSLVAVAVVFRTLAVAPGMTAVVKGSHRMFVAAAYLAEVVVMACPGMVVVALPGVVMAHSGMAVVALPGVVMARSGMAVEVFLAAVMVAAGTAVVEPGGRRASAERVAVVAARQRVVAGARRRQAAVGVPQRSSPVSVTPVVAADPVAKQRAVPDGGR
jgi:hypothetical protein